MTVSPVTAVPSNSSSSVAGSSTAQASATLNYNDFLQLLIAQLKNQDPTAPNDPTTQISQLASFSQVEQQIQSNTKLDSILAQSSLDVAGSYVGKYLTVAGDSPSAGFVSSVKVYSDGLIATLKDGTQVLIGAGVSVSDTAPPVKDSGSGSN